MFFWTGSKTPSDEKFNKLKTMYSKLREEHIQLLRGVSATWEGQAKAPGFWELVRFNAMFSDEHWLNEELRYDSVEQFLFQFSCLSVAGETCHSLLTLSLQVQKEHSPNLLTLSLPKVINVKFPLQPHQKYYTPDTVWKTWLLIDYSDE